MIKTIHSFSFPPKQEVDFTSTETTGKAFLFYCFGSREIWRENDLDVKR